MFWGLSAMTAAEWKLPDRKPYSWLGLGQGTYNTQRDAWDTSTCGGGLHWQLWSFENGYDLKNAVSNGGFFQLAARLYRYTNNTDYLDWARKSWEWSCTVPLVNNKTWIVSDSTSTNDDCSTGDTASQWSYNYGIYMTGCAYIYSMVSFMIQLRQIYELQRRHYFPDLPANQVIRTDPRRLLAPVYKGSHGHTLRKILHQKEQLHHVRLLLRDTRNVQQQRSSLQGTRALLAGKHRSSHPITIRRDTRQATILRHRSLQVLHRLRQQHMRCSLGSRKMG